MDKIHYILWCVVLVTQCWILTEAANDRACPELCFCQPDKFVYCSKRGVTRISSDIEPDAVQLNMNGNILDSSYIQRRNFSHILRLEHLYLSECGIERIEVDAFADLTQLKFLDLSANRIKILEDYTFLGLTLSHLFLNGNRNIDIKRNAFGGLQTSGLYLQECSLSRLNLDVFEHLNSNLTNLWLNNNELVTINKKFLPLFSKLTHIRLGSNPFHCNCELSWLKEFYDASSDVFTGADQPSCLGPQRMRGQEFNVIPPHDFQCQPPSFKNIDAIFKGADGMLRCTASGDPSPLLYWVQPSGVSTVYKPSSNDKLRYNDAVLNVSSEHTPRRELSGSYFCVALNEAGNMTFTFNLTWPTFQASDTPTIKVVPKLEAAANDGDSSGGGNQQTTTLFDVLKFLDSSNQGITQSTTNGGRYDDTNDDNDDDMFISIDTDKPRLKAKSGEDDSKRNSSGGKQYTAEKVQTAKMYSLPELIGAILGTFFATLLLCIILIPLYFRRRWKNNNSPHHSLVAGKSDLQETLYLNGTGSRGPQLPPRPPGHNFTYFDSTIQSLNNRG